MKAEGIDIRRRGILFIISGPSGAGKTSVSSHILESMPGLEWSVSVTTRAPRPGETAGVDYDFVSASRFDELLEADALAEWAEVHGNRYGTPIARLVRARAEGRDVLMDIDVQGAAQIKKRFPDAVAVFLVPPTARVLAQRIAGRATEDEATVRRRLAAACNEIAELVRYDYVVVNEDLENTRNVFRGIVHAERHRVACQDEASLAAVIAAFGGSS